MISNFTLNNYYQVFLSDEHLENMPVTTSTDSQSIRFDNIWLMMVDGVPLEIPSGSYIYVIFACQSYVEDGVTKWESSYRVRFNNDWYYLKDQHDHLKNCYSIKFIGRCYQINVSSYSIYYNDIPYTDILRLSDLALFINLYQYNGELDVVSKTLNSPLSLFGQLTEECDILNPSILIQWDDGASPLFKYNYAYISMFNRYYFITGIVSVRKGIWRINCKVDVLKTYDADIRSQGGLISRASSMTNGANIFDYTIGMRDSRIPVKEIPTIDYTSVSPTSTYVLEDNLTEDNYTIAMFVLGSSPASQNPSTATKPTNTTDLPSVTRRIGNNPLITGYTLKSSDWSTIANLILATSSLGTDVVSIVAFPYRLNNEAFVSAGLKSIYLKTTNTGASGYWLQGETSHYIDYGEVDLTHVFDNVDSSEEFLYYEPYSKYEVYLPYAQWVTLNSYDILNCKIGFYYILDFTNGKAEIIIYNKTKDKVIKTLEVQIGILMSISSSNNEELQIRKGINNMNVIMGVLSSFIAMGTGGITAGTSSKSEMGYGGIIAGALGGAKSVVNYIGNNMLLIESASTTPIGDKLGLYLPKTNVIFKRSYYELSQSFNLTTFVHRNGYKLKTFYSALTNFTGYTEVEQLHYTPSTYTFITSTEIEEIESLAEKGIIL